MGNFFSDRKAVVARLVAVMDHRRNDRRLVLSQFTTRCVLKDEIHEFLLCNPEKGAEKGLINEIRTCNYGAFIDGTQRLVHVDRRAGEQPHRTDHYRPIRADVRAFLEALAPMLRARDSTTRDRIELQPFWSRGPTHTLCEALSEILPDHSVLVADASVARGWAGATVELRKRGQRLLTPAGSGSLSYALPAAIGAKLASPDSVVVAMGGDGGFSMAMHDLETAVRYRLPILFVLLNNKSLGLIDSHMTRFHGAAPLSQAFHDIDWARVVQAHGWKYIDTRETSQISDALRTAFPLEQPTLMEVRVPQEEISPDLAHTIMAQQPARRESLAVS